MLSAQDKRDFTSINTQENHYPIISANEGHTMPKLLPRKKAQTLAAWEEQGFTQRQPTRGETPVTVTCRQTLAFSFLQQETT